MEDKSEIDAFNARTKERFSSKSTTNSDEYEVKMVEAFVGKPDEPAVGLWYANAFMVGFYGRDVLFTLPKSLF